MAPPPAHPFLFSTMSKTGGTKNKKSRRTSSRLNADDTAFWFEPTKPPAARPLRGGTTWFAEIAPSGDRAHGIGPQDRTCPAFPWLLCPEFKLSTALDNAESESGWPGKQLPETCCSLYVLMIVWLAGEHRNRLEAAYELSFWHLVPFGAARPGGALLRPRGRGARAHYSHRSPAGALPLALRERNSRGI